MPGNRSGKGHRRWLRAEIAWGLELAGYYDVAILDDDRWDEEWQDDGAGETDGLRRQLTVRLLGPPRTICATFWRRPVGRPTRSRVPGGNA